MPLGVAAVAETPSISKQTRFSLHDSEMSDPSDDDGEDDEDDIRPAKPVPINQVAPANTASSTYLVNRPAGVPLNHMFTKEELAVLPAGVIDRQKLKQQAKKAKKRQAAKEKTEGELMYGMMGMDVEHQEPVEYVPPPRLSAKQMRKEKKRARDAREKQAARTAGGMELDVDLDRKKEEDFASFLANVGGESCFAIARLELVC